MNRKDFLLKYTSKESSGLEIGPSHNPTASKSAGYNVEIIDHTTKEGLIEKYQNDASVDTSKIEDVDYVWEGQPYKELTKKSKHYDWIIASHVIEHTPDIIRFINDCNGLLADNGKLILAIPGYRYCFDQYRAITGLSKVIDAHLNKNVLHSAGTIAEFYLNASKRNGQVAWGENHIGHSELLWDKNTALEQFTSAKRGEFYIDAHAWCFTPNSFRLIMHDLENLGLTELQEVDSFTPGGSEFFCVLSRKETTAHFDRLKVLEAIQNEIAAGRPLKRHQRTYNKWRRSIKKRFNRNNAHL